MINFIFQIMAIFSFFLIAAPIFADLYQLEERAKKELEYLNFPQRENWIPSRVTSRGDNIYDVVIVGGGQAGITIAFALKREKVSNILVLDENEPNLEGSWLNHARMDNLRTPKYLTGPDCDIPSLTMRSWFESKYGEARWNEIEYISRVDWIEYLQWLKSFLNIPLVNNTKVGAIEWSEKENSFRVPCKYKNNTDSFIYARKVVLATGVHGSGEWAIPEHIKKNIPHGLYYHTSDQIDFTQFKGKKVGILGGGPCAFDNAYLCSAYAEEVHMFFKKPKLVNIYPFLWAEFVGFQHFSALPDESKWQFVSKMYEMGQPPTPQSVEAVKKKKNIILHFDSPWMDSKLEKGKALIITPQSKYLMDNLIVAIGWTTNLDVRNELVKIKDKIALWSDKFTPPVEKHYVGLLRAPYLTRGFCFMEKIPGTAPYVHSIFNCTGGAFLSNGFSIGTGISGMRYSIKALVNEIVDQLFVEDREFYYETLENYDHPIFDNE